MSESSGGPPGDPITFEAQPRDRVTVRRALTAGLIVWMVLGLVLGGGLAGAGGRAVAAGVLLALVAASLVTSSWLVVALGLDVYAGHWPSRRRLAWTIGATAFTFASPIFVLAIGG